MGVLRVNRDEVELSFEDRGWYLYALAAGPRDTVALSEAFWRAAVDECRKRQYTNLLVEGRFPNELSLLQMYELVTRIAEMPIGGLRLVYLDQTPGREMVGSFAESVGVNRWVTGRVCSRLEDAEALLRE